MSNKITNAYKFLSKNGYNNLGLCLNETIYELYQSKYILIKLFNEYGGINNIHFASSILLRAILTIAILLNILYS